MQCLRRTISLLVVNIPLSKLANFIYFKARFPVVSMNFCILVYFKSWQNRVRVDDRVLIDSDTIFVNLPWGCVKQRSVWRFCALQKYIQRKHFYYKCHRSGYFNYIENLAVNNGPFWITLMACCHHADHWRKQTSLIFFATLA